VISANRHLQELWDIKSPLNLTVMNGEIQIIGNPILCVSTIQKFVLNIALVNANFDQQYYRNVNGHWAVCKSNSFDSISYVVSGSVFRFMHLYWFCHCWT